MGSAKSIAARMHGDDFQGRIFWRYATQLFMSGRHVTRVQIESEEIDVVDDVVVDYSPYREEGGQLWVRDYIQCKHHVAADKTYSAAKLCDPAFFRTKQSFLARSYSAFLRLQTSGENVRVCLLSNGDWESTDSLRSVIGTDGRLRDGFYVGGDQSNMGKIRKRWCCHLGVDEAQALPFFRSLRLRYNELSGPSLVELIDAHLSGIGLKAMDWTTSANSYDAVYAALIKNNELDFDREAFAAMCSREKLGTPTEPSAQRAVSAGIRSFVLGTSDMDMECDPFLCLCDLFDSRELRDPSDWNGRVAERLGTWCENLAAQTCVCELRMECHSSIALAAGRAIASARPAHRIHPLQGSKYGGASAWVPSAAPVEVELAVEDITLSNAPGLAVAMSVTHDITPVVRAFLAEHPKLEVGAIRVYRPATGVGYTAIPDGTQAWGLADAWSRDLAAFLDERSTHEAHLFTSAPNAFVFVLGWMKRPRDAYYTWEHNWDGSLTAEYVPAITVK